MEDGSRLGQYVEDQALHIFISRLQELIHVDFIYTAIGQNESFGKKPKIFQIHVHWNVVST